MANYYSQQQQQQQQQPSQGYGAQNLQFYSSSYNNPVSGHSTPAQASYSGGPFPSSSGNNGQAYGGYGGASGFMSSGPGFGASGGVSGRMGEQGGLRTGWLAAFGTEGYDGEPPLLEELGVNFGHIQAKTLTVLNPMARIDQHIMDDSDLFGPIIFFLLFGTFLLFSGKVHFGYIYGLAAIGSVSLHVIFNLMSNPQLDAAVSNSGPPGYGMSQSHHEHADGSGSLTFWRSCSVLGYCLLPLVLTSLVGVALPLDTAFGYILTTAAVAWCTFSSSGMFCAVGHMRNMRPLVAYPLALFYFGFGTMSLFSSRGSGHLAAKAGI